VPQSLVCHLIGKKGVKICEMSSIAIHCTIRVVSDPSNDTIPAHLICQGPLPTNGLRVVDAFMRFLEKKNDAVCADATTLRERLQGAMESAKTKEETYRPQWERIKERTRARVLCATQLSYLKDVYMLDTEDVSVMSRDDIECSKKWLRMTLHGMCGSFVPVSVPADADAYKIIFPHFVGVFVRGRNHSTPGKVVTVWRPKVSYPQYLARRREEEREEAERVASGIWGGQM
ncbi:hypothetical protein KIPB_007489, partial [Kipferlia bialata]